ncbi:MAG: DUF3604 domain-containing protein [Chloroflexi bacterium]|nr:DUF3604 domain-containing protein [Chloroflexota bacterium]
MRQHLDLGTARIEPPDPIVAGSYITLTFIYTAGHPIDDSGAIRIVFRSVGDFGTPQFSDPLAPNYCTVHTDGDCRLVPRWDPRGNPRPWWQTLQIDIKGGYLDRGRQIVVVFGDRSAGSPGWRAQTFRERSFEFKTLVDPIATCLFKELPTSPVVEIVAGEPVRAICLAPSQVNLGQPFDYALKLEDRWGNPVALPQRLHHDGFAEPGPHTVSARDRTTGLCAESNPIEVRAWPAPYNRYWADMHGQSEETVGTDTIDDYMTFARDMALLDIVSHQGNDFQISDAFWQQINETTRRYYQPGRLVTFPGYEWSGNTPLGGDRNVLFASEGGIISHSCTDLLPNQETAYSISYTADELFRTLRRQAPPQPFVLAHVGGRYADLSIHDEEIEIAVEIHSAWGTFEWLLEEALERGYRIGVVANSDGHKCRPGASYPGASTFGSFGGLTCVLASELTREAIVAALRARHCYATTGHRPLLDVRLALPDGSQVLMGDLVRLNNGEPRLVIHVVGTAPIEAVHVRNGLQTIGIYRPYGPDDLGRRVKVIWSGAEVRGRARMTTWDGFLHIEGNALADVQPINFWNPELFPRRTHPERVEWHSVTSGGLCGLILTLDEPGRGTLQIHTTQGNVSCPVNELGLEPRTFPFGGLRKRIDLYRLPDDDGRRIWRAELPLTALRAGDNPLYVRVDQEDGHMAWSSPIYLVKSNE